MDCCTYACAKATQHRHHMGQLVADAEDAGGEDPEIDADG